MLDFLSFKPFGPISKVNRVLLNPFYVKCSFFCLSGPFRIDFNSKFDKGIRAMHAFRTLLGDYEDFSNLPGGVS